MSNTTSSGTNAPLYQVPEGVTGIDFYTNAFWAHLLNTYPEIVYTIVLPFSVLFLNYVIPSAFMYVVEYVWAPAWLKKYKIQPNKLNPKEKLKDTAIALLKSYFFVILPLYSAGFSILKKLGFSTEMTIPTWWKIVLQIIFFLLSEDFFHYWFHRALHHDMVYKRIHAQHHEYTSPVSLAASYAHPLEVIIEGLATFSGPLMVTPHMLVLFIWVNVRQFAAIETHCGYDFPFSPNNICSYFGGADFHDFHHRAFNGAYSSNFIWWDVIFGTDAGYWANKKKREQRKMLEGQKNQDTEKKQI